MFCNSKHDVIHIHGSLEDKSKLSVTLRTIAKGISLEHSKGFKEKSLNKSLLVIGYSGNDKDVIDLINESSFQKIYWMIYDIKNEWELQNISSINKNIILFEGDLIRFDKDLKSLFGLKHNLEDVISRRKISINKKQIIKSFNYPTIDQLKFLIGVYNSIGAYESVIEICSKFKNKIDSVSQRQYLLNRLCAAQRAIGSSFSSASYYANQAIKLYNVNGYSKFEYIMSLNLKGLIFLEKKRSSPKDALKKFLDLDLLTNENKWKLAFKDEIQMKTFKGRLFNNIGLCYMELKSYSQAQKYFKEAITSKRENGDLLSEIITLCNLCVNDLYFLKKEKKIVIDRLLFLFVKYENDVLPQIAYYYRRTGMVNCEIGNIKVGIKRLEKSIAIYKKLERTDFDDLLVKEYLNKYGA
jgi:tetratricopeptide (TPR) repeat protein